MKWELAWQNSTVNQATHDPRLFGGVPVCGPSPPPKNNAGFLDVFLFQFPAQLPPTRARSSEFLQVIG